MIRFPLIPAAMALLLLALAGCAAPATMSPSAAGQPATTVARTSEQGGKFIALVGPRRQHAAPFLGVPGTNFYALRSWIDTRNGESAHQLYVSDSYPGAERHYDAAHDAAGDSLRFIAISDDEITCDNGCSYAEEFAAALPETLLRTRRRGIDVTFTAKAGPPVTIAVPGELIDQQLTAVDEARATLPAAAAVPPGTAQAR